MKSKPLAIWLGLIALAVAVIYGSLVPAPPLTWDDDSNIFANPYFLNGEWAVFWQEAYFGLYVPVTSMFWRMIYGLGGGAAWPFRVFNLLLHLANTYLVFRLLEGLARRWTLPTFTVVFATAVFALHPLQVHAVAWISGGRDLLGAFFALAAVCAYYAQRRGGPALATALFLVSTLCKPSTVILPVVIAGLDFIFDGRLKRDKAVLMALWVFFAGAVVWLTRLAQKDFIASSLSIKDRALVVMDTYSFYLQKFVAPYPLTANYARTPEAALADPTVMASVLMTVAVLAGFILLSWRQDRRYLLILVWFAAMLPVSGIVSFGYQMISTVSDHYNYLPMAILAAVSAQVLARIEWHRLPTVIPNIILAALIAVLSLTSWNRAEAWTSDTNFFTDMSKHSPESYSTALGMSIVSCEDLKQYDEGVKWTMVALKAKPLDILALANQAYCFLHARNYFRVIELEFYLGQLDLDNLETTQPTAYSSLLASIGTAYIEQHEYEDGFQFLCEALRIKPSEPSHQQNLNIAKDLLKSKGIEPTCEQVRPEDEEEPIQEIWPDLRPEEED